MKKERNFEETAMHVSSVSIVINVALSLLKFIAGVVAHSGAMVSDAVHSASDVFSTIVVMIGVKVSGKESDEEHPYGHERFECVAAILLAVVLLVTGIFIGHNGLDSIAGAKEHSLEAPTAIALVAAMVSIVVKEAMYWYTIVYAKKIRSSALKADAWHHRSDALSSVGALVGIGGAMLGYPIMDPIASLVICVFIVKASWDIFYDAIKKMTDQSCGIVEELKLRECILQNPDVMGIDVLRTRVFGNRIYVDVEISADGEKKLKETHQIAESVHDLIEQNFKDVKHVMVHVNPFQDESDSDEVQ